MTSPAGVTTAAGIALDFVDRIVVEGAREIHHSVSERVYGLGGLLRTKTNPLGQIHRGIADTVFTSAGASLRAGGWTLQNADNLRPLGQPLERSAKGQFVLTALNGMLGAPLGHRAPGMTFDLTLRVDDHDVVPERAHLAQAYPAASDTLVVFVHGLCENEHYWDRAARPGRVAADPDGFSGSYGSRLQRDFGWTPVFIRANTGVAIRESGTALSATLARAVEYWPVPVRRLVLIGHSMGGLIIRAACDVEAPWTDRVSDIITLGTPHLGSPVERGIERGMRVAHKFPELAVYRRIFQERSPGVRDLHHGMPELTRHLPHVRYRLVAGSLTKSPAHPVAMAIGDLLVQPQSAFGRPQGGSPLFPGADELHVPGADHFDLLNHGDVYEAIKVWLADPNSDTMNG